MKLLEVNNVSKRFGGLTANQDVTFTVDSGQIVGLIGPNGAGKTTLFNCVAGYFAPTSGSITLGDRDLAGQPPEACARAGVGRTFQIARTFTSMTACENVMTAAMLAQHKVSAARESAMQWLAFVNLDRMADKPAGSMTISEQRRLAVARALAINPRIAPDGRSDGGPEPLRSEGSRGRRPPNP